MNLTIYDLLKATPTGIVTLSGWVRANRAQKDFGFIELNDGSAFESLQVVYNSALPNFNELQKIRVGSSIEVTGEVVATPSAKQPFELQATQITLIGDADLDYPIQPKRHTREFLRKNAHLRMRTNLFNAVFRVRSLLAFAVHEFFRNENFVYAHSPIITANDGEGAGNMFRVTTLDLEKIAQGKQKLDHKDDFFGKHVNLTVTGQLEAETFAMSFGKTYTFGPTFRAENSNTTRHAAEFWMIEPEIAFADLNDVMDLIERLLKYTVQYALDHAPSEMAFFDKFVCPGKIKQLQDFLSKEIVICEYRDAIEIFKQSGDATISNIKFGDDLSTPHEKYLTDVHFKGPVFVTNWPEAIKAFYMRENEDGETVAAVDLLVPGSGELVGGSQREERLDVLIERMKKMGVPQTDLEWYLDLRRYGSCKHGGFGVGFDRLVMYVTGIDNIRDTAPFPRTPNNCEF